MGGGWRSYFVPYNSPEEREKILQTIKAHNSPKRLNRINLHGHELVFVVDYLGDKCILFGNSAGSRETVIFFRKRHLDIHYYEDDYVDIFGHEHDMKSPLNILVEY
jgi:hypothetical protein